MGERAMKASEVLRKAKGVLGERGWCQLSNELRPGGPCCMMGALRVAATGDAHGEAPVVEAARVWLNRVLCDVPVAWNDTPGRTVDSVQTALDKAIALAEAEEAR